MTQHQRIYFSDMSDAERWTADSSFATFVLIPRQWWLLSAWTLAWHLRSAFLNTLMRQTTRPPGGFIKFDVPIR